MKRNGYDQFFKEAKKNAQAQAPVKSISAAKLRENMQQKKSKKSSRKFPAMQFVLFVVCGLGLFLAIENFDKIESTLQKVEIGLGVAEAQTSPAPATTASGEAAPTVAAGAVSGSTTTSGTVRAEVEDDSDYIYKLSERKKVLDAREEELNKKAAEIEAQKAVIEKKLVELEEYRTKISTMLQDRIKSDDSKVETLVQVYTNMKPGQAAKIFETMDEDLVIDILSRMKKKSAAEILNLIKTEKAQAFAERYAGYRVPTSIPKPADKEAAPAEPEATKP
ncbi:MotE family protein [Pseudobdellovibrio sp. HCB154]|uniref:MotE family protein n=1 Tax=Pseudobdellovibrio sp. HCB154 TaxID=3386277 RepID=UPI0039172741